MDRSPSPFLSRPVSLFGSAADGSQIQASHEMLAKSSGSSPLSPIRIKQEGTFYARLLSKENSLSATPSFRVYHGVGAASVPFVWESQPGTPKATFPASQLPPLTPPPSYFHHPRKTMAAKKKRKSSRSFSYLATLFRRLTLRKPCMPHPPMPKSPVSSVLSSPFSRLGSSDSRQKHSFSSRVPDDEDAAGGSILCFRLQRIPRLSMFRRRRDRQKNSVLERFG